MMATARSRRQQRGETISKEVVHVDIRRFVSLRRAGCALQRLVSLGLAAATAQVKSKLMNKFPTNPSGTLVRSALPPTLEIELSVLLEALHSFPVGAGPGPDDLRADFLKGLVGHSLESPLLPLLQAFIQEMADANVSLTLQPWLAGGTLIGVGKIGKDGIPIDLAQDARPIAMGQIFRKLVFKYSFRMDSSQISARLLPHQFVIGISGGTEILVHSAREWIGHNRTNPRMVLL